jgi:putative oxygen-independent coproporphyrinogen III oxidase
MSLTPLPPLSLYIHIPWCQRKCPYCDFNSHASADPIDEMAYVNALLDDLQQDLPLALGRPLESIFIGGGTPSLFSGDAIARLLQGVREQIELVADCEITMEANPGTVEADHFAAYRKAGVNRLSIGVQSFSDEQLQVLERIHSAEEAITAVSIARKAGFDNINLDLMFGLPGQSLEQARDDLQQAIALKPEHISYYQLTIEPNTRFYLQPPVTPDDDLLWSIQQQGQQQLADAGYQQYEVSAYAREGRRCQHNLNYWLFGDYLGIGAGAHAKTTAFTESLRVTRRSKHTSPQRYLQASDYCLNQTLLGNEDLTLEFMMFALRLVDGFPTALFSARTGVNLKSIESKLMALKDRDLIEFDQQLIRPTVLGRQFLNELIEQFMA